MLGFAQTSRGSHSTRRLCLWIVPLRLADKLRTPVPWVAPRSRQRSVTQVKTSRGPAGHRATRRVWDLEEQVMNPVSCEDMAR